ncbi:MAG: ketoacyl-ACP synthase III [Spirochaetales bacterium]|nr:ketoacyl-ACP synthase III [Spirochaetales bacterium]
MHAAITAVTSYVPDRVVTNDELSRTVDTSDEWIRSHTGIGERRIVADGQAASDIAVEACLKLMEQVSLAGSDIDLVILASSTTDYANFPATACIVQDRIGASEAGAFDLSAGCTGFVYALEVARSFVVAGTARRVLVVGSEVLSRISNWEDRNTCVLFGDGAGAVLVEPDSSSGSGDGRHRIVGSWLRSRGSGATSLMRPVGGTRTPFDASRHTELDMTIHMDGRQVYLFAVDAVVRTIRALCDEHDVTPETLDWVVPHQANLRIIEAAAKRLKLPPDRFFTNLDRFANTSAASIPLALDEMQREGRLSAGQTVLTVGFGAGLTYGGNIIRW